MIEASPDAALEALLEYLKQSRGFDFTGYKRASLQRRIIKRMHEVKIADFAAYIDFLEVHPDEFTSLFNTILFNTILINVTSFFRDPDSWAYLAEDTIPALLASKSTEDPIRICSAGCASGEEACSIAILMAEALGISEYRRRVKIYATDIDEESLETARRAHYSAADVAPISEERLGRFFEARGDRFILRPELRRSIIFGRHDLIKDPPMSRLDLIICRNVLMYLNSQTQQGVVARFHFALSPPGRLFLGRAEMLTSHSDLFAPNELTHRIFSKIPAGTRREHLVALVQAGNGVAEGQLVAELHLRASAFNALADAQLVIDRKGELALANRAAREKFGLTEAAIGQPLQDLELSYKPIELRSLIDQAYQEAQTVRASGVKRTPDARTEHFALEITPLRRNGGGMVGVSVSFKDVTVLEELHAELRATSARLEEANQAYQSANEELETTNEELQSTNEELETTNEELQSSNEELETMNEELLSTNEELRAMNEVLHEQTRETDEANAFLESVLAGLRAACVVVDADFAVHVWKEKAEDLWGVRSEEVEGRSLLDLDIGLPVATLRDDIAACFAGSPMVTPRELDAINRRGHPIRCRVTTTPLYDLKHSTKGAILLIEVVGE